MECGKYGVECGKWGIGNGEWRLRHGKWDMSIAKWNRNWKKEKWWGLKNEEKGKDKYNGRQKVKSLSKCTPCTNNQGTLDKLHLG